MNNVLLRVGLVLLVGVGLCHAEEFTLEPMVVEPAQKTGDARRYTQVRDDLLELLALTMESSVVHIEKLSDKLSSSSTDGLLRQRIPCLIKQLAGLQAEICRVMRKIAEGVSGMSCKRLKKLEAKFLVIKKTLQERETMYDQKKLEKTGKNGEAGEADKKKLRENIEQLSRELL